jgi:hypothetical protein
LEAKLHSRKRRAMRCLGLRALNWPFESKDMDKIITNLQQDQDSFAAALQIDQAYAQTSYLVQYVTDNIVQRRNSRYPL